MSEEDIQKGQRGLDILEQQLADAAVGIVVLTPENFERPWILFEAGALSNSIKPNDRVCPLLIGMKPTDISGPLVQFQLTEAKKNDVWKLITKLNTTVDPSSMTEAPTLRKRFESFWPDFERVLDSLKEIRDQPSAPIRSTQAMTQELLDLVRDLHRDQATRRTTELSKTTHSIETRYDETSQSWIPRMKPGDLAVLKDGETVIYEGPRFRDGSVYHKLRSKDDEFYLLSSDDLNELILKVDRRTPGAASSGLGT